MMEKKRIRACACAWSARGSGVASWAGSWARSILFFFQAEDGIRDHCVTGVQTCALPISTVRSAADIDAALASCDVIGGTSPDRVHAALRAAQIGRAACREREELRVG